MPKYTRIALEGATIDGRTISRKQIQQMAEQYDPDKKHGARIWLEHFRSLFSDGAFPALGDVISLKTEEVEVDGKKRLGLYAELQPTDQLLKMNQQRQKVFTSVEIDPDYAGTGKAYLTGLAVTDSPASQGTQMLAFSQKNNFAELQGKLFSEYLETELKLEDDEDDTTQREGLFSRLKKMFSKHETTNDSRFSEHEKSMELLAQELDTTQGNYRKLQQEHKDLSGKFTQLEASLKELQAFRKDVEKHSTNKPAPKAAGGSEGGESGKKKGFF
jgi:hypothetical protein